MASNYRQLTTNEIAQLTNSGCSSDDWTKISVRDAFHPERIQRTHFSGNIKIGVFQKEITFAGGVVKPSGIRDAIIHNCIIGNDVYIHKVNNYLANYEIEDNVIIENVDLLTLTGETAFGNGTSLAVVIEGGGRELLIYDHLSAQVAYILTFYRHQPAVIRKLEAEIRQYADSISATVGRIGRGSKIINCCSIKNVKIGPAATLENVEFLENGSINSVSEAPIYIGPGVIAKDFIVNSGSTVSSSAILSGCFVGQNCVLDKQFTATHSAFFSNCEGSQGEASSILAGPYTVTHHESTILIASYYSFYNAGSGTNQSNHRYKLGPMHQGILERGVKTASASYLVWPTLVGAFSVVLGRHDANFDSGDLPFSYLVEGEKETVLVPAVNLRSIGTFRDANKWVKRDGRTDPNRQDYIIFDLFNPFIIQKIQNGQKILKILVQSDPDSGDYVNYQNLKIRKDWLMKGQQLYEMAIIIYFGNCLIKRLSAFQPQNVTALKNCLLPETTVGKGRWCDLAGLIAPHERIEELLHEIAQNKLSGLDQLTASFQQIYQNYSTFEWKWGSDALQTYFNKNWNEISVTDLINFLEDWKKSLTELTELQLSDAQKEFSEPSQISFGIDGSAETRQLDFRQVRGTFEEERFINDLKASVADQLKTGEQIIQSLKSLR